MTERLHRNGRAGLQAYERTVEIDIRSSSCRVTLPATYHAARHRGCKNLPRVLVRGWPGVVDPAPAGWSTAPHIGGGDGSDVVQASSGRPCGANRRHGDRCDKTGFCAHFNNGCRRSPASSRTPVSGRARCFTDERLRLGSVDL
jgi:hypothetical protein